MAKKKTKKYSARGIAGAFSNAYRYYKEEQKKKQEYLTSPQYKKKMAQIRKNQLAELNYQIQLEKKKRALNNLRNPIKNKKTKKEIKKPMGLDIGSELGLS